MEEIEDGRWQWLFGLLEFGVAERGGSNLVEVMKPLNK